MVRSPTWHVELGTLTPSNSGNVYIHSSIACDVFEKACNRSPLLQGNYSVRLFSHNNRHQCQTIDIGLQAATSRAPCLLPNPDSPISEGSLLNIIETDASRTRGHHIVALVAQLKEYPFYIHSLATLTAEPQPELLAIWSKVGLL